MKVVRIATSGTVSRTRSMVRRKISALPPRRMLFNTGPEACCNGMSRYLQMVSCPAIVSSKRPVTLFG